MGIAGTGDPEARLELVDALRGYALMGLFLVHMCELFELWWAHPADSAVHDWVFTLFAGKAYALFALCFGFSFFIIMDRAARRGVDFSGRFVWRLALLFVIGWLHGLVYRGDIIVVLATLGLLLVPLNRIGDNRILAGLAALAFALPYPLLWLLFGDTARPPHFFTDPSMETYLNGGFGDFLAANLWQGQVGKWWYYIESGRIMQIFGLFLTGLILGRIGFFAAPERFVRRCWIALAIALAAGAALSLWGDRLAALRPSPWAGLAVGSFRDLAWTAVTGLALVGLWQTGLRPLLRPLVPAGRVTLTLYIGQSLIFVPVYYGFGLGWHDDITQVQALLLGFAAFALQLVLAAWWVRRYRYGPLEWLWRAGTYMTTAIPFRR
jgi:uncharacterized protein